MKEQSFNDEFLHSVEGIKPADAGPFFYTRLMGRMQKETRDDIIYKPAWMAIALSCFIAANVWMIAAVNKNTDQPSTGQTPEQAFAETYQLNNYSNY
ncbi:MAG: hypothetical protein JST81_06950 [Bacteroidetes bacterium]|jgi:hypothetical protein|nr:hypothetical protein [Bacteroidota bacterium]